MEKKKVFIKSGMIWKASITGDIVARMSLLISSELNTVALIEVSML